ncbi:MAG: hypothetical protein J3K34DRAFT_186519 [Monoraphidium minutum]|nr:MAG: hypothetical protein J3K34DRAFT_186519 [Monoraphidium minutum]
MCASTSRPQPGARACRSADLEPRVCLGDAARLCPAYGDLRSISARRGCGCASCRLTLAQPHAAQSSATPHTSPQRPRRPPGGPARSGPRAARHAPTAACAHTVCHRDCWGLLRLAPGCSRTTYNSTNTCNKNMGLFGAAPKQSRGQTRFERGGGKNQGGRREARSHVGREKNRRAGPAACGGGGGCGLPGGEGGLEGSGHAAGVAPSGARARPPGKITEQGDQGEPVAGVPARATV